MGLTQSGPGRSLPRGAAVLGYRAYFLNDALPLTSNEIKVLGAIVDLCTTYHDEAFTMQVTMRDVCAFLDIAPGSTILNAVRRLSDAGLVRYEPGRAGTIRLAVECLVPRR